MSVGTSLLTFGDSITYGALASDYAATSYVARIAAALGLTVDNRAISGATMLGTEDRASILQQMLNVPPPVWSSRVAMLIGTNDMGLYGADPVHLASFSDGLHQGLLHLASAGAPIWVGTTLRQAVYVADASEEARLAYCAVIEAGVSAMRALGRDVYLVPTGDVYDPTSMGGDPPSYVHPTDGGHGALAGVFLAAMGLG